jgi:hypothetical protein
MRWRHTKVGPLPPVLREETAATTVRVLVEIRHWYNKVYGNCTSYPVAAWDKVMSILADNTDQSLDLANREVYRIALPSSLTSIALTTHKFTASSCLPATPAFSGEATYELLHALLLQLSTKFGCKAHPEDILAREPAEQEGAMDTGNNNTGKIIIGGGSNCKRLANLLRERGMEIIDLTVPGWTPTTPNITELTSKLTAIDPNKQCIFVSDLLSNVCFGFEQLTGTVALPIKTGGKFHMYGRVSTVSKETLNVVLEKVQPVLSNFPGYKIVLPPLPRYLHNPCCTVPSHCEDIGTPEYPAEILAKTIGLRKIIRDFVHSKISNVWVPDTLAEILEKGGTVSGTVSEQAEGLRYFYAEDGVHMSREGAYVYAEIVNKFIDERITASSSVSGKSSQKEFFWRGFVSTVGSSRPSNIASFHSNRKTGGGKWRGSGSGSGSDVGSSAGSRAAGWGGRRFPPAHSGGRKY